ncbi:MAG: translocation/assembly module TamB domain-containing protein [Bacteroidia bacterium]
MKKLLIKISYTLLGIFFALLLLGYLIFNSSRFQNFIIQKADSYLSKAFKCEINIGHINYDGWTTFSLDNIYWGDQKKDTLFFVKNLQFDIGGIELDSSKFILSKVNIDGGMCKIITYPDKTFNIDVLFNIIDKNDTTPPDPNAQKFKLIFDEVNGTNCRFKLIDSTVKWDQAGFNPFDQDFYGINIKANHFKIIEDSLHFFVKELTGFEKCGLQIKKMACKTIISPTIMEFANLDLQLNKSKIKDYACMKFANYDSLAKNFISNVKLIANLKQSFIHISDIAFFAPMLNQYNYDATITAKLKGTIDNLDLKDAHLKYADYTEFHGRASMNGLPNIEQTFIEIFADSATSIKKELDKLAGMELPKDLERFGLLKFKGSYTGFFNDFVAYGNLETPFGNISSDLNMKLTDNALQSVYSGKLDIINFNLGTLLNDTKQFGNLSLTSEINGKGFDIKTLKATTNTNIQNITYNGYNYKNIQIKGDFDRKYFNGKLLIDDENIGLSLIGKADLNKKIPEFLFETKLNRAKLKTLNLYDKDIIVTTQINGDFTVKNIDQNSGDIIIENTNIEYNNVDYTFDKINIKSSNAGTANRKLIFQSDFLNASINGEYNFLNLHKCFNNILYKIIPAYLKPFKGEEITNQNFDYNLKIKNTQKLTPLFFPEIDIEQMEVKGNFSNVKNKVEVLGFVESLRINNYYFSELTLKTAVNSNNTAQFLFGISKLSQHDTVIVKEFAINANVSNNKADLEVLVQDTTSIIYANINSKIDFSPNLIKLNFNKSYINYSQSNWTINPNGVINFYDSIIKIEQILLSNSNQLIGLNGRYEINSGKKNILLSLTDFEMNNINFFYPKFYINLDGKANGNITYQTLLDQNVLNGNVWVNDLKLDNDSIGDIELISSYDNKNKRLSFEASALNGKLNNFKANGFWLLNTNAIDASISLTDANANAFQPFVKDYITIYEGKLSLKALVSGTIDKPDIDGFLQVNDFKTKINYLQTTYHCTSTIHFDKNIFEIQPFFMSDIYNNKAKVSGSINHNNFNRFDFDINISNFKNMMVLNTTSKDNSLYHGVAFGSGNMTIKGPLNDVALNIEATTEKGTKVAITPFGVSDGEDETLIHFYSKDTVNKLVINRQQSLSGFSINCLIRAKPNAEVQIIFNEQTDDKIRAKGIGDIKLELTRQGAFNMYGEYIVNEGDYVFTALNIVPKKFVLQKSTINWSGDPLNAQLNILGIYKVKTTVNELTGTNNNQSNGTSSIDQKTNVEAIMNIRGTLVQPEYKFDLNFPDLDNSMNSSSISDLNLAVNTLRKEPENMTQQIISLIVFGKFSAINNNNSGGVNNNIGVNTLSELASSQVSNIVNKYIPNFDLNFDLQNAIDPTKNRSVIISGSTKWFNNKLEVKGSFATDNSQNNLLAQYNISQNGNFKARAFNRLTLDPIFNRNITTQGIGLYYRKEFDGIKDLFIKKQY